MCHYESWQCHDTKVPELLSKYCSASMRRAVISIVIALAFGPQAFAVLRPLFPVKPEPPFSGGAIDLAKQVTAHHWQTERGTNQKAVPKPSRLLLSLAHARSVLPR